MPYTKTNWTDRIVASPMTFRLINNGDGTTTLQSAEGAITQAGTPLNSLNLNHSETQYDQAMSDVAGLYLAKTGGTVTGQITMQGDIIGTGYTVDVSSLREDGVRVNQTYLKLVGGTVTGALTVNGILQSGNSLRADIATAGQTTLVLKNSVDDSYLRVFTTASNNYIASSNYASTASKPLIIAGYGGNAMSKLTVIADTSQFNGTIQGTTINGTTALQINGVDITTKFASLTGASFNGTISAPTINATTNLQELGTNLSAKYAQISSPTFTGNATANVFNATTELRENGTALTAKYAQLGVANTFTVGQTISSGGFTLNEGNIQSGSVTNDGKIRTAFTATNNYIQSGNQAGSAKNFVISGWNASTLTNMDILATTVKISGNKIQTEAHIQSGMVTITPVANTPTSVHVTFSPAFTAPPIVTVSAVSGVPFTQVQGVSVSNITATGCDVYLVRNNTNSTNVNWIAQGTI